MHQDKTITAFQFLEEIQKNFLQQMENANGAGDSYETRRLINFFDNTATLQVLPSDNPETNGNLQHLAVLSLQSVSQKEELPTFSVGIAVKPSHKSRKMLVLVNNQETLESESSRICGILKTDLETAAERAKQEAEQAEQAKKETEEAKPEPAAEEEKPSAPVSRRASRTDEESSSSSRASSGSSRLRRRSSLRNRDQDKPAEE